MTRAARRCAICHRMIDSESDVGYMLGRNDGDRYGNGTPYAHRILWLCEDHGKEIEQAIRALAWENPWAKVKV